jgi:hypothetical protein
MSERLSFLAVASLVIAACGGGPPGPTALAYTLPDPAVLTYLNGDTVTIDIDAGGQSFQITQNASSTLQTSFARADDGVQVTLTVRDLAATMTQPLGSPVQADESGVEGALVFTMDRRGEVQVVSQPTVSDAAATFFGPLALAHSFFPALPGRPVTIGDAWTDTVRYEGPQGRGSVSSVSVLNYTVTRDTVLAGRSVLRLDVGGTSEQSSSGTIQGMSFSQSLSGAVEGFVLWDVSRAVLVESYGEADLRGTMDVAAAPFPLTMRARAQSRARLGG